MALYKHLPLDFAKKIIILANKGMTIKEIKNETGISKGKIKRCFKGSRIEERKENKRDPWKGPHIRVYYSFKQYRWERDQKKMNKANKTASECEGLYSLFIMFCKNLFDDKLLGVKARRSADEFIKEFKKAHPNEPFPKRSWVYCIAKSPYYTFNHKWLPSTKDPKFTLKSDDESKKPVKYNSIETRPDKELLRQQPNNYEIDSVIGKREDKQALLTLIDIHTGDFYSAFYDRTMGGFKDALKGIIEIENITINTLTMDNGGENNLLHELVDISKLFNCHPYCSGEKGTLENKHRIVRRLIPKGISLDKYINDDLLILNKFVNNYYSKTFNRI